MEDSRMNSLSDASPAANARYFLAALLIVALASGVRMLFFGDLGRGTTYLTYYPAVVLAALYGGVRSGLLATAVSGLLCFFWIQKGYMSSVESMAMGVFLFSCAMISGIAEAMRRAQALAREAQAKAEAANLAKSAFLARMSHELRTPLNAILGFTNILRRDRATPQGQQQILDIVNRSGEHLLTLINDVLDMAKIDSGHMEVDAADFDLRELTRDVIEMMCVRAEGKGLLLKQDIAADCPQFVRSDAKKLRQVLVNLIGNAIKFTDHGHVIVRLSVLAGDASQRLHLGIEVEDSGIGIAAADQAGIFEPFIQAGDGRNQKGTGLGLAITRRFVELLGGTLGVRSEPGKGSIFRIEVPVGLAQTADGNPVAASSSVIGLAPDQPDYRLLIVEDQMENWLLLQHILESVGFQVRVAQNGLEGIAAFADWRPHLIWMDIRMPVMDGLEATRRIRALEGGAEVKILAITASVFTEERDRILAAGMDELVRKPYRAEEIYDALARFLGVRFVESSTLPGTDHAAEPPGLLPGTMDSLTEPLRGELEAALITLDSTRIATVIERIGMHDARLGMTLQNLAGQLNYSAILHGLKDSTTPEGALAS
jgi:signal transduction histidine kinase/CheY-like chemotaxis protein